LLHAASPCASCTLSLHDALPISLGWSVRTLDSPVGPGRSIGPVSTAAIAASAAAPRPLRCRRRMAIRSVCVAHAPASGIEVSARSEEHTSELQSRENLVCRLLLE